MTRAQHLTVSIGVLALLLSGVALLRSLDRERDSGLSDLQTLVRHQGRQLTVLEESVRKFKASVEQIRNTEMRPPPTETESTGASAVTEDRPELLDRIAELEDMVYELRRQQGPTRPDGRPLDPCDTIEGVERARTVVADRSRDDESRLEALVTLRRADSSLEPYDEETLEAVVDWLRNSATPRTRESIARNLHGWRDEALIDPLIEILRYDSHSKAREEAAETLDDFPDAPRVIAALEYARKYDKEGRVSRQAERALRNIQRHKDWEAGLEVDDD